MEHFIYFTNHFKQGGETSQIRRPQRKLRVTFPPTPAVPPSVPHLGMLPPSSTVTTHLAPTPGPPSAPPAPPVILVELSREEIKQIQVRANREIVCLMMVEDAVPEDEERDKKVARAISTAIRSVVGETAIKKPPSLTKNTIGTMATTRRAFKQYVFCHIHKEFGLRLEPGMEGSEVDHRAARVGQLLRNFNFLRDLQHPDNDRFFSSPFFRNYMIDMLFLSPMTLWNYIPSDGQLDKVFGLGGTALASALKDFIQGYYCELSDCSADKWRDDYLSILALISSMRADPIKRNWLTVLQQSLMMQGRAGLPPSQNPFYTFV